MEENARAASAGEKKEPHHAFRQPAFHSRRVTRA